MAINMLSENEYITCPKCKSMTFRVENSFTLRKQQTPAGIKLNKKVIGKIYVCSKCGADTTNIINQFEIMGDK